MGTFSENVPIPVSEGRIYVQPSERNKAEPGAAALMAEGIGKAYGATVALQHADIALKTGEVHALLGENGAGKSTLVRVLTGAVIPDAGTIHVHGAPYHPKSIEDARVQGVATAFQELSLVPNLSVAENLLLPHLSRGFAGMVSARRDVERAAAILAEHKLERIDPRAEVSSLPLAERQRLEIVRAIKNAGSVLILDEPTASLAETDWLFDRIHEAVGRQTAVLYISHRLSEVREICQSATVLRNGKTIASLSLKQATDGDIFEMMVGRRVAEDSIRGAQREASGNARLCVHSLSGDGLKDVSFDLRAGEVLGIAALEGQGQRKLFRILAGLETASSGSIELDGRSFAPRSPGAALKIGEGIAYLPEERKTEGILGGMTAASNVVLPILGRAGSPALVNDRSEFRIARPAAERVDMAPRYLGFAIADLSGGNQQKALIARVLATGARTLLLFDPTRGVDVGTKASIYAAIRAFAQEGGSVLFYSSELPELVQLVDRCLVLYAGRLSNVFSHAEIDERILVTAMTGHHHASSAERIAL